MDFQFTGGKRSRRILWLFAASFALAIATAISSLLMAPPAAYADEGTYAVFVASDRHATPDATIAVQEAARDDMASQGIEIGTVVMAGDLVNGSSSYNLADVQAESQGVFGGGVMCCYTYGSHDVNADITGSTGFLAGPVDRGGYYLYGIHYDQMTDEAAAAEGVAVFRSWAESIGDEPKPILVVCHVPLHERRGDNVGAPYWTEALNEVAATRTVLYVWGHNHTGESDVDTSVYYVPKGGTLAVEGGGTQTIGFAYANAGYLKNGYGSVFVVSPDSITLRRYSTDGLEAVYELAGTSHGTCGAIGDNVSWELRWDGKMTIRGNGDSTSSVIGSRLDGLPVSQIRTLVVEDGVTSIPSFRGCSNLRAVTLSRTVRTLQRHVFYESGIQRIDIPRDSALTSIGAEAFATTLPGSGITSIELPASLKSAERAFAGCGSTADGRRKLEVARFFGSAPANLSQAFEGCSLTAIVPDGDASWIDAVKSSAGGEVTWLEYAHEITYRLYNPATSEHLWTTNFREYSKLGPQGWVQEGVGWISPSSGEGVYRLYNPGLGTHHYTMSENEIKTLTASEGWLLDNAGNPLFLSSDDGTPVYRLYNDALSQHHLTKSENEYNALATMGWTQEGVAFYVD